MKVQLKRAYEEPARGDGVRILIDRLWPRGLSKKESAIDDWAKDIAPSTALRKWFDHDPERWTGFKKRYRAELKENAKWKDFKEKYGKKKTITLLYATKEDKLTHALVLKQELEK